MHSLSKKAAYLKGFAAALDLKKDTNESKMLDAIIDTLEAIADEVEDIMAIQDDLCERVEDIDEALFDLEDDFYGLGEELDDEDFDDDDGDEVWEDLSIECPKCGSLISIDETLLEHASEFIVCPSCGEKIELEF